MSTIKKRINISVSSDVERAVYRLAARDQVPHATKAAELILLALEMDEDHVLDLIAGKRDTKVAKFISHKLAWK